MTMKRVIVMLVFGALISMPLGTVLAQEVSVDGDDVGVGIATMDAWWPQQGHFTYDNGTVTGSYLNFGLDIETGTITDYTVTVSILDMVYPMLMYERANYGGEQGFGPWGQMYNNMGWTTKNVTVFDSIEIEDFVRAGEPGSFAEMLVFQGEDVLLMFYDYEGAYSTFYSDDENMTLTFSVPEGFEVTRFPYQEMYTWEYEWKEGDVAEPAPGDPGMIPGEPWMPYLFDEVWIKGENTTTTIFVQNGEATINGNVITVELGPSGNLGISTWAEMPYEGQYMEPWVEDIELPDERDIIDDATEDGLLAAVGYFFLDKGGSEYCDANYYKDPTFNMEFSQNGKGQVDVEVSSRIPEGRIVSVSMNEFALKFNKSSDLVVKLDGETIKAQPSLERLTEIVGGAEAGYWVLYGENGNTVFVYVPHFSTHTISMLSVAGLSPDIIIPTVLAVAFVAVTVAVVFLRAKKGRDEY